MKTRDRIEARIFLSVMLMAGALLFLLMGCQSPQNNQIPDTITIKVVHSPELRAFLSAVREQFSLAHPKLQDGSRLRLELISELGVNAARKIARGEIKPDAWLAPSLSFVNLVNARRVNLGPAMHRCETLFSTPVVIAARREHAALLSDGNTVSINELFGSALGGTEDLSVTMSHGQPRSSSTGLSSLIQLAYAARYPCEGDACLLSPQSLTEKHVRENFSSYQRRVLSYPLSESYLLLKTAAATSARPRVALTTEQQVVQFLQQDYGIPKDLVVLYPKEGAYWDEYALCVADADWVSPAHQAGLALLREMLASETVQREFLKLGFRPAKPPLNTETPTIPLRTPELPQTIGRHPAVSGETVGFLIDQWPSLRRPAALIMVLDTSGSMEGDALDVGKEQFRRLIAQSAENDQKALIAFGTDERVVVPFTNDSARVIQSLDILQAAGGSAVYNGIQKGLDLAKDPRIAAHRKILVVFTDGNDRNSEISLSSLLALVHQRAEQLDVGIIMIGVDRGDADFSDLERISDAADGVFRRSALINMSSVFEEVMRGL